jgi:glycosyltransferase involved in cell wall biosynthesis
VIIFISPSFYPAFNYGGPTRSSLGVVEALSELNKVLVITTDAGCPVHYRNQTIRMEAQTKSSSFEIYYGKCNGFQKLFLSISAFQKFFINSSITDVVIVQSVFNATSILCSVYAVLLNKKLIVSVRGSIFPESLKWKKNFIKRVWWELVGLWVLKKAKVVHVTSEKERLDVLSVCKRSFNFIKIPNSTVTPYIKKIANFYRCNDWRKQGFSEVPLRLLFSGRSTWEKGFTRVIDIANDLLNRGVSFHVLVLNLDSEESYGVPAKLNNKFTFLGSVHSEERCLIYGVVDWTIVPALSENFSNVALESYTFGTPIVLSRSAGISEYMKKGQALIVNFEQPREFSECVDSITSIELRKKIKGFIKKDYESNWNLNGRNHDILWKKTVLKTCLL